MGIRNLKELFMPDETTPAQDVPDPAEEKKVEIDETKFEEAPDADEDGDNDVDDEVKSLATASNKVKKDVVDEKAVAT